MALAQAIRRVSAIFIKTKLNGADAFIREPMNVVALDFQTGQAPKTYLEPAGALLRQPSPDDSLAGVDASARAEVYDEVRFYDRPPFPKSRWGVLVI